MTLALHLACTLAAAGTLAWVYALEGWWPLALAAAAVGLLGMLGTWRGWAWSGSLVLLLLVSGAAGAFLLGGGLGGALAVVVAALCAWDLEHLWRLLQSAPRTPAVGRIERRHLLRLLLVALSSGGLAAGGALLSLPMGTGIALLLALLAVCGVGEVVAFFRRESD